MKQIIKNKRIFTPNCIMIPQFLILRIMKNFNKQRKKKKKKNLNIKLTQKLLKKV